MNKEQAIEIIETHSENISSSSLVGRALDIAIDALKAQLSQEGTTKDTTSDLISRQQALNALIYAVKNVGILDADDIRTVFKALPTIQPEPCGDKSYALWKESYEELKRRMDKLTACSDTISRQAAIDALDCINGTEEVLRSLPPAQPKPQEGHWIDKGWNGDWAWQIDGRGNCWRVIECSECGKGVSVESNYCPHCGAHMKGAEHETD